VLLVLLNPPQDLTSCRAGARPGHPISGLTHRSKQNPRGGHPIFAERNVMEYPAHSFRLDVRRPDYLAPLLGFVSDELGEVGRRARKHRGAQIGNPRLHLGISEPSVYFFVEFVDYLRRRALGRTEAAPEARLVAR